MSTEMNLAEAITYLRPIAASATVGHYAEALGLVLAAASVTQPEPEYEYGNQATFHFGTQIMPASDRETAMKMAWLQPAFRRVKAGAWEPVPNQSNGSAK